MYVVVAGAGHNSLIAAAYLTRAGCRCRVLDARALAGGGVASHDDLAVGSVRMQKHEAQRVARVEVPDFVEVEPVEQRPARRIRAVEPDACRPHWPTGTGRHIAAEGLVEERPLHRQRVHTEALEQHSDGRVDCATLSQDAVARRAVCSSP